MPVISNDRPAYRVLAPAGFFGPDDHLYVEGAEIYFDGEPNLEFEPLNSKAHEAMNAYIDKLNEEGQKVAAQNGRAYAGIARTLDEAVAIASSDARRPQLVQGGPGVPLMGARKAAHTVSVIGAAEEAAPQDGRRAGTHKRGSMSI